MKHRARNNGRCNLMNSSELKPGSNRTTFVADSSLANWTNSTLIPAIGWTVIRLFVPQNNCGCIERWMNSIGSV